MLLAVAALLVNAWIVTGRTRPAAARDGGDIVYTNVLEANVKVEGTGPPILLVNGFAAALDWWDGIAPELAKTHRVIRLDLIGHGGTAAPPTGYAIEHQAELVASVLRKLKADRVTAIGHSMGGEVVTVLAEANPGLVERIIILDTPPVPDVHFDLAGRLALMPVIGPLLTDFASEDTLRKALAQGFAPGFPVPEKFVADMRQLTYNAFRSAHDDSVAFVTTKPTVERLAALTPPPPLLVIFARSTRWSPPTAPRSTGACRERGSRW